MSADPQVLAINGGSSSLKFALFEACGSLRRKVAGSVEGIGLPAAVLRVRWADGSPDVSRSIAAPAGSAVDHATAAAAMMDWLAEAGIAWDAVGHRIVHGGPLYSEPQRVTPEVLADLRRLTAFDPEHLPAELLLAEVVGRRSPTVPQVACFDTAFHHDLPRVARLLPIPRRYEAQGLRRYGFHGLSYAFLMDELARVGGADVALGRVLLAHLGSGASLAAVRGGRPIDTSMGFTPASGVPMSTRSGDLDPGLFAYLSRTEGMNAQQFDEMVTARSGLLGVSETSPDMRVLLAKQAEDLRAAEAVALFCYQVKKCIGAFAAALGGVDTLVFAGGIGENAPPIRERICEGLGFLGITLDARQNAAQDAVISVSGGAVTVRVLRTDEEQMIARSVCHVLEIGPYPRGHA